MDGREEIRISKFLSLVLRHDPARVGIHLDEKGWTPVADLLQACRKHGMDLDREKLERIVKTNQKQRFSLSRDGLYIRANQGHSVPVNLDYLPKTPPEILYHGTASRFLHSICKQGLLKQRRHHVHLSDNPMTAKRVGLRHGFPVVLRINALKMHQNGHIFFLSENGVWLTEFVPPRYLKQV